ncbi:transaldolase [Limnofasciculus baicalensis]|uniref:Transaldolase n=1 Tax=Limnofasciculus baicalensis BBK-W-15 TaxID=2699891 RepID=A0AAE3GNC9_9CYAN|nr:transaldolase [Limnofasciculus baicalensis]MCP2727775.1 transaldolase [Limnofasciculus baicalensis BBK-W-15]
MFKIKLFADGANLDDMLAAYYGGIVQGFTTNPTLMRKAGITDYEAFAREVLTMICDRPISFEVFADDFETMYRQAHKINSWGENVYVKIPITNTKGESAVALVKRLVGDGIKLNVTAILTLDQVQAVNNVLSPYVPAIVSVFAGRIADTGSDPVPIMAQAAQMLKAESQAELLWASPREVLNVYQAEICGCDIITATGDILKKLSMRDKDLSELSRETVQMFYDDACKAGFKIDC